MRHSPEPWTNLTVGDNEVAIEDRNGNRVASVPLTGDKLLLSEALENVKLITASPLLMKAAIMAMNWMECDQDKFEEMDPHDQSIYTQTMADLRGAIKSART